MNRTVDTNISIEEYRQAYVLMDRIQRRCRELERANETKVTDRSGYPMWDGAVEGKRAVIIIAQFDGCRYEEIEVGE